MAVRTPLKLDGSDLREMTTAEINAIKDEAARLYGLTPSVTLSVVASGGNLGTISDTRLDAGAGSSSTTAFPDSATTDDVSTITVNYSKIDTVIDTSEADWTNATYSYPLYYDGADLVEMSAADFGDTFIKPAIDDITATGSNPGTYFISTSNSVVGATLVSATPVFTDTRYDPSVNTADLFVPEDNPITITNYYLHKQNGSATPVSIELPICYTKSGIDLQAMPTATIQDALETMIRYYAAEVTGTKISYNINGTGTNQGSTMTDTKLNSSTYYTEYEVTDTYKAQEIPSGTATTISTYNLKITQT